VCSSDLHPATYDLLLQVLGEGRLSDSKGRVADFRNAVIIMTSNLGAASYQRGAPGFADVRDARDEARDHFTSAVRKFLRPEMFNRIDAIVAFSPLDRETVRRIARREVSLLTQRDGIRMRRLDLTVTDDVADYLAEHGFDARYGARPLKRFIEESLTTPLASRLNAYTDDLPLLGSMTVSDGGIAVQVAAEPGVDRARRDDEATAETLHDIALQCVNMRGHARVLQRSNVAQEIENEVYRLSRLEQRSRSREFVRGLPPPSELEALPALRALAERIAGLHDAMVELEERCLLAFYERREIDVPAYRRALDLHVGTLGRLLVSLYARRFPRPHYVLLGVFSDDGPRMTQLAMAYVRAMGAIAGSCITARWVVVAHDKSSRKRVLR
jgi:hypothetical protein